MGIGTQKIIEDAWKLGLVKGEELLKQNGLHLVDVHSDPHLISTLHNCAQNAFMTVHFSDLYQAISWNGMHAHDHGLGGKHLWPVLQQYIKQYGQAGLAKIDAQYVTSILVRIPFPANIIHLYRARSLLTWQSLYHFDKVMDVSFFDATKLKDLVKVSI